MVYLHLVSLVGIDANTPGLWSHFPGQRTYQCLLGQTGQTVRVSPPTWGNADARPRHCLVFWVLSPFGMTIQF